MPKQHKGIWNLRKISRIISPPFAIALLIFCVGLGLFFGMYAVIQDVFFNVTVEHEMMLMNVVEAIGSKLVDEKLSDYKDDCFDRLTQIETEVISVDESAYKTFLENIPLPTDGLNFAYLYDDTLVCRDDSFREDLELLNLSSVVENGNAVILNPYFDSIGNFILTVVATTETSFGTFIVQYDAFCMSNWLKETVSLFEFGTAYIIDSEGYNIATAKEENFDWITTRYNAQIYAEENPTTENISIAMLEKRALLGEYSNGTYEWDGGTSYVAFGPLTEVPWGYCVGFYGREFTEYVKSVTVISGQSASLLLLIFGIFVACIVFFLFRSLEREQQYSMLDPLTGVKNKRAWMDAVGQLDDEIQSGVAKFAIAICDVNYLKQANDTMGHKYGDNLIIHASRYICKIFSNSPVYRIGGDEFAVILKGEDLIHCEKLAEEFDLGLTGLDLGLTGYFDSDSTTPPLSIALGISQYQREDTASDVFHKADNAMYQKKMIMKAK